MYLSYKLAAFLTRCMVRNGSIEDNQYDAYLYCLDYLLELVVYFVTTFRLDCCLVSAFCICIPMSLFSKELLRRDPCPFQTFVHSVFLLMFFCRIRPV